MKRLSSSWKSDFTYAVLFWASCLAVFFGRQKREKYCIFGQWKKPIKSSRDNHFSLCKFKEITHVKMNFGGRKKKLKISRSKRLRFKKFLQILTMKSFFTEKLEKVPVKKIYDQEKSEKFP